MNQLAESITDETALVSIMYANNETGVILPVEKAAKIVKAKNPKIKFHSDAVQAAGKIPLDVKNTDIDLLTIAGHKIHAPKRYWRSLYQNRYITACFCHRRPSRTRKKSRY